MSILELLEVGMLLCFGFAWPFNIYKSLTVRSTLGKSLLFMVVIWAGYLFGIFHKALSPDTDFVLWLYVINILLVSIDIALYFRNRIYEKRQASDSVLRQ